MKKNLLHTLIFTHKNGYSYEISHKNIANPVEHAIFVMKNANYKQKNPIISVEIVSEEISN